MSEKDDEDVLISKSDLKLIIEYMEEVDTLLAEHGYKRTDTGVMLLNRLKLKVE